MSNIRVTLDLDRDTEDLDIPTANVFPERQSEDLDIPVANVLPDIPERQAEDPVANIQLDIPERLYQDLERQFDIGTRITYITLAGVVITAVVTAALGIATIIVGEQNSHRQSPSQS
ncbi:hypothetical protein BGZ83_012122 [Gryganskiella cystojenkinii]|nr:hypothetical protein BGZ83_012122 [Gryganskiella cystojenkinii]